MTKRWMVGWAIVAAVATPGCMEFAPPFLAKWDSSLGQPKAELVPCSSAHPAPFTDSGVLAHRAYTGPMRTRQEVAVIVTRSSWPVPGRVTSVDLTAVDGRAEVEEQDRATNAEKTVRLPLVLTADGHDDTVITCESLEECFRLAVLPGPHVVTLSAVSYEADHRRSRRAGQAHFVAAPGRLYSPQVCRPKGGGAVFWIRDETLLTCASTVCPTE